MTYDPATLEALNKSIEHWRRMADGTAAKTEHIGPHYCALCNLFRRETEWKIDKKRGITYFKCDGCPVWAKTGKHLCEDTPYGDCEDILEEVDYGSDEFRAAAKLELEFLQGLLPPVEAKA